MDKITSVGSEYSLIVLDEILDVVNFGYLSEEDLLTFCNQQKNDAELLLTGHRISDNIKEISDYVSEVKEVKHPYQKGMPPRKGFEY
jgi:cob(I)alamin adenosyltransferase